MPARLAAIGRAMAAALLLGLAPPAAGQTYLSDEEAIALEHQTRFARMRRIAREFAIYPEPEFREYRIPRSFMPPDFPHDVPVLRIVFPESTFFDTARSEIKPGALPIIRAMAEMLDGDVPDVSVFVAGHADSRGGEVYNHNLSVDRARVVARVLNDARGRPGPAWSIGFGESVPLYPNSSEREMGYNRRVEFLLAARPDAIAYWLQDQVVDVCRTGDASEQVRCMRDFQQQRKEFVAEEVAPVRVQPREGRTKVRPTEPKRKGTRLAERDRRAAESREAQVEVAPPPPRQVTIRLNERRQVVEAIEH